METSGSDEVTSPSGPVSRQAYERFSHLTDGELRDLVLQKTAVCVEPHHSPACPFELLHKLTHASCNNLISAMKRGTLILLLDNGCDCGRERGSVAK